MDFISLSTRPRLRFIPGGVLLLCLGALGIGSALAAQVPVPPGSNTPTARPLGVTQAFVLVTKATHGALQVQSTFAGPDALTGVVVDVPKQHRRFVAWILPNGKGLVVGPVFSESGVNLTARAMHQEGIVASGKTLWNYGVAHGFTEGHSGPVITAYVDPNCIYCHLFYDAAQPLIRSGRLRVRFVVTGFLKRSSPGKAESILSAKRPLQALAADEKGFDVRTEEGAAVVDAHPSASVQKSVQANTAMLAKSGELATPTLIYSTSHHAFVIQHGLTGPLTQLLPHLR